MADTATGHSLAEVAAAVAGELVGDGARRVSRLGPPQLAADAEDLALAVEPPALAALARSPATAAVVTRDAALPPAVTDAVRVARPRLAMVGLLELFDRPPHAAPGVHPTAFVDAGAT